MWGAMRLLGKWCRADIQGLAAEPGTDPDLMRANLATYIIALRRAGYLIRLPGRVQVRARIGRGQARWRLLHDTGPLSPQVRRGGAVYDRNLGRVVTAEGWA
jgi:hypothetical protein